MSEYITFFIRKDENIVPIGSYSRQSMIWQATRAIFNVNQVYGATYELQPDELDKAVRYLMGKRDQLNHGIAELERDIADIATFNNSISDKLDAIFTTRQSIAEERGLIEEVELGLRFYSTLQLMGASTNVPIRFYCGIEVDEETPIEDFSN